MDLRHLRYFLAVAEEGHFGRAARRLNIVQPALSMQIRALEDELGTPLFLRTSRKVELTEAGRLLCVEAEQTLLQAERAKSVVQRAARGETGSIRIAFAGNAAFAGKLSADLRVFHDRRPAVQLDLCEMPALLHADALLQNRCDIAYCPVLGIAFDSQLVADRIGSWPWLIAMAADNPLSDEASLTSAGLADERFILYAAHGADVGQLIVLRQLLGREPRIVHRVANTLTVLTMVAAGLGLALVPGPIGAVGIDNITYRPLADFDLPSELVLLSRASETSCAVKAFVEMARRTPAS
ncbi:LysR substrate-binding domain-containing protein [Telmatospirillum sp.]|uniref:LysR substrate-binding domain-containing protein n=1 Tax=Telmatospirillum sp. TaxID=2079197 RepID=UPI0028461D8E|nr:LysR substrate-binding domain-containing protein [Telmatospirillum sp.]MDR3438758.1 LysR substrate-binding domain-containing protein [Telmatospirillum sp.]